MESAWEGKGGWSLHGRGEGGESAWRGGGGVCIAEPKKVYKEREWSLHRRARKGRWSLHGRREGRSGQYNYVLPPTPSRLQ